MIKSFECPIYNFTFHVVKRETKNNIAKYAKKFDNYFANDFFEKLDNLGGGCCLGGSHDVWLFFMERNVSHKLIVHECFHAVFRAFHNRGIELGFESEENYAYYLGFVFENVNKILKVKK